DKASGFLGQFSGKIRLWDPDGKVMKPEDVIVPPPVFVPVQGTMAEKIRKALDAPFTPSKAGPNLVTGQDVLDLLRKHAKGVNIRATVGDWDERASMKLSEPIPLGALFQWTEDQFGWRFVIREYGIVATDQKNVPPGAMLLLDFWRHGQDGGGAP